MRLKVCGRFTATTLPNPDLNNFAKRLSFKHILECVILEIVIVIFLLQFFCVFSEHPFIRTPLGDNF